MTNEQVRRRKNGIRARQAIVLVTLAIAVGNINAVVDGYLHPEIPYFDVEHIIVGGITAVVGASLLLLMLRYSRQLAEAEGTINRLEAILPVCARCKKIRKAGTDPKDQSSWQPMETYFTERTNSEFSHDICPECMAVLYPEYVGTPAAPAPGP